MTRVIAILVALTILVSTVATSSDPILEESGPLHIAYAKIEHLDGSYLKAYEAAIIAARTQLGFTDYQRDIVHYEVSFAESERNYKGSYVVSFDLLKSSGKVAPECRHPPLPTDFYVRRSDFKVVGFGGPDFVFCR
jgi:hypothetical protein